MEKHASSSDPSSSSLFDFQWSGASLLGLRDRDFAALAQVDCAADLHRNHDRGKYFSWFDISSFVVPLWRSGSLVSLLDLEHAVRFHLRVWNDRNKGRTQGEHSRIVPDVETGKVTLWI